MRVGGLGEVRVGGLGEVRRSKGDGSGRRGSEGTSMKG